MTKKADPRKQDYPSDRLEVRLMNATLRHLLRNHCAGIKMVSTAIASKTSENYTKEKIPLIQGELKSLEEFTARLDLIFDDLPAPRPLYLHQMMEELRDSFVKKFPFCSIDFSGPELDIVIPQGSWVQIALTELLANAGEAAGRSNEVEFGWSCDGTLDLVVLNTGSSWPDSIPLDPPLAFHSMRGGYNVGLGLSVVRRICDAVGGELLVNTELENMVAVKLSNIQLGTK